MKSTGVVRRIDELGRVVIPMELRQTLDMQVKDPVEFFVEGDKVILKKYRPGCIFCNGLEELSQFDGKPICADCIKKIRAI